MNICVLSASPPHVYDAVGDACWRLAQELARESSVSLIVSGANGVAWTDNTGSVSVWPVSPGWGLKTLRDVNRRITRLQPDVVLVHFVPQLYGWNGAKPGLALLLHRLKRRGYRIVTVAHEFSAPFGLSPKLIAWSVIHRVLLRMIVRASRQIVLTTASRCEIIRQRFTARRNDCCHIPIGSTIPVVPVDRVQGRSEFGQQFGIAEGQLVVATFGTNVESVVPLYEQLFRRMIAQRIPFCVLLIGKSGDRFRRSLSRDLAIGERLRFTGPVPGTAVSRFLSLCDLYVAFYPDGASTHRTSLLAGLAHGIPTISNRGVSTEPSLVSSGAVVLIDRPLSEEGFREVGDLCRDSELRSRCGERGRNYHDEHHSWSRIGHEYLRMMTDALESA